jgi:hypothetical protein
MAKHWPYDGLLRRHGYRRQHDLDTHGGYALHYERSDGQHVEVYVATEWAERASRHQWVHSSRPWAQEHSGVGVRSLAACLRRQRQNQNNQRGVR